MNNEELLSSFINDLYYISREKSIEDLVHRYRDKLMFDENFFNSQCILLREESLKRIFNDGILFQDDYYELEDLYRDRLLNNPEIIEHDFKNHYGVDIKYEKDVGLLSLKHSDKRFLPKSFLNKELQSFVKDRRS